MEKEAIKQSIDRAIHFIHIIRDVLEARPKTNDADFREAKRLADDLRKRSEENMAFQDKVDRESGNKNKDISAI